MLQCFFPMLFIVNSDNTGQQRFKSSIHVQLHQCFNAFWQCWIPLAVKTLVNKSLKIHWVSNLEAYSEQKRFPKPWIIWVFTHWLNSRNYIDLIMMAFFHIEMKVEGTFQWLEITRCVNIDKTRNLFHIHCSIYLFKHMEDTAK